MRSIKTKKNGFVSATPLIQRQFNPFLSKLSPADRSDASLSSTKNQSPQFREALPSPSVTTVLLTGRTINRLPGRHRDRAIAG
jgi:hypothetical protein